MKAVLMSGTGEVVTPAIRGKDRDVRAEPGDPRRRWKAVTTAS